MLESPDIVHVCPCHIAFTCGVEIRISIFFTFMEKWLKVIVFHAG